MKRKLQAILIIALISLTLVGCKNKENEVLMFCSACLNESAVSKYCPECGVEAKWITEKINENEIEEKKIEDFIGGAEALFNEGKYEEVKIYLSENVISEDGNTIKNEYTTEEQKEKAVELYKNCNAKIEENKQKVENKEQITSTESTAQEEQGICMICEGIDVVSNLASVNAFGKVHNSCYSSLPTCSVCKQTKLWLGTDEDSNGICDYNCDNLCTSCWVNEANVKGGLCNDCEWNKYYSDKASCGGCTGNIVDASLAGTICPDCGYEFELIN